MAHYLSAADSSSRNLWAVWLLLIFPAIWFGIPLYARLNVGKERRKLERWATPFLEAGEQIQAVFTAGLPRVAGTRG